MVGFPLTREVGHDSKGPMTWLGYKFQFRTLPKFPNKRRFLTAPYCIYKCCLGLCLCASNLIPRVSLPLNRLIVEGRPWERDLCASAFSLCNDNLSCKQSH